MPPAIREQAALGGVSFHLWTDPSSESTVDISLQVDLTSSLGELVMRYRTIFAAFPLLVVALVLRKQFQIYDESGYFIPFTDGLDRALRSSFPLLLVAMSLLATSLATTKALPQTDETLHWGPILPRLQSTSPRTISCWDPKTLSSGSWSQSLVLSVSESACSSTTSPLPLSTSSHGCTGFCIANQAISGVKTAAICRYSIPQRLDGASSTLPSSWFLSRLLSHTSLPIWSPVLCSWRHVCGHSGMPRKPDPLRTSTSVTMHTRS